MSAAAMFESSVPGLPPPRRGKVRDIYDLGDRLLLVATDRISAFDSVFPTPIPDKGRILTLLSLFWFDLLKDVVANHLAGASPASLGLPPAVLRTLEGRALVVKKAEVAPFECIVRGYLAGSGWKDYQRSGEVCGVKLPAGLQMASRLDEPVFTPSTKAETGHDRNVAYAEMEKALGPENAARIRDDALILYSRAADYARGRGIIIADAKFEFGFVDGKPLLVDEVLTPDSSRFWPLAEWKPGENPPSFDKQCLRDWVERESGWDKEPPAPELPPGIVAETREKYVRAYRMLSGRKFA
ncbi:MAG: phosphoribosylaminoimidazolesuccinocarboxamide synthase [Planctomycetota bacterium]|nr:phosphoribosylaminoimidazolesuccinocarboxamide synthase [Planctomycetota bacterium]